MQKPFNILVTGATGYIGSQAIKRFAKETETIGEIYGLDIKPAPAEFSSLKNYHHLQQDIRDAKIVEQLKDKNIQIVVHLASLVGVSKNSRDFEYSVEVEGAKNLLNFTKECNVKQFVVTSSGAAYGYHEDNPEYLSEDDPIRGNYEFPYAYHKRRIEEEIELFKKENTDVKFLIFRPGTILGKTVNNQITDLFKKPVLVGIKGSKSPFNFILDEDVVECLFIGMRDEREGTYNLAGDGYMTFPQIAQVLKKPFLPLPQKLVKKSLGFLSKIKLTQYGPEQTKFLAYRPVLSNKKLKSSFGYTPKLSSEDCFYFFLTHSSLEHKRLPKGTI
jgi:UDP-glucose 4-epimerase